MIPEETIARVRESVNIVELVREHVPALKKRGRNYLARCPFHQERTPSFNVNPEMGLFKCFGCGAGGDAFKFLMLTEGMTYPEAIRKIAGRVGIVIEEARGEALSADAKEKQLLYGLLEDAARFYHRHLMESPDAAEAKAYLTKRGLDAGSLEKFAIGFAPASGHALRDAALRKGCAVETLEKAGLVRRKDGGRIHDYFWSRIIFPIWDVQGRMVAFGGRAMGEAQPKYINSPDTPLYSKSRHLYGLFQGLSTLRKGRQVVILEGYMDVVMCHQFGLENTAATLGTALTEDHVRILRRYAEKVTLLFDPDAAGAQASLRGGELLVADGFSVDVVTLPGGLDPDEILVRDGPAALEGHLKNAVPFMDYSISEALKRHPGLTPENKLAIAKDILPLIHNMRDPLLQDEYLSRLANALRVEKVILGQQMKRLKLESRKKTAADDLAPASASPNAGRLLSLEEEMMMVALLYPSEEVVRVLNAVSWRDLRCAQTWLALRTQVAQGALHLSEVFGALPEGLQEWLTPLALHQRTYVRPLDMLEELVQAWRRQQEARAWQDLKTEIDSMIEGQIPIDDQKVRTYNDLSRRLKGSKAIQEAPFHG